MKKVFKKFHLWLSVPFGLIISIICFSGAALVFETEITELCYPERYFVSEVGERTIPIDELVTAVAKTLPDSVAITQVVVPSNPKEAYQVGLSKPRRASVSVDQYTGEVKERVERAPFFTFMMRTHRWLLDSMKPDGEIFWGKIIVGTSTLLFVIILITGIVIWWPRTAKALRNTSKIAIRKGWLRFWHDLHVAGGMYALILLLVMSLTGLTWSFQWYRTGFYKVFGVEMQQGASGGGQGGHGTSQQGTASARQGSTRQDRQDSRQEVRKQASPYANWQHVYDQLNELNPGHKQISISAGSANVTFDQWGNQRGSDRYTFDAATGEITNTDLYKNQDASGKIRGWIYSVHVGSWGGMLTKILTFVAAFVGGTLPLTGYYFWIRRTVRKRRRPIPRARY